MRKERWHTEPEPDPAHPSKSQVKRDLHKVQDFALELLEIPQERLDDIEMDERLRDALAELRRITHRNARGRQVQYVAKLLHDADLEPFRAALAAKRSGRR